VPPRPARPGRASKRIVVAYEAAGCGQDERRAGALRREGEDMKKTILLFSLLIHPALTCAVADPMRFQEVRNGGNCSGCAYCEITADTPRAFEAFVAANQPPGIVRLNSPGGNLAAGLILGEMLRAGGYLTEVGASTRILDAVERGLFDRAPGTCASACAYAFLGGTSRSLDEAAKIGFQTPRGSWPTPGVCSWGPPEMDAVEARAANLLIARGAYREAARMYPDDLIELRQSARLIEKTK
jgi:hypothetical protein